jgi:hypothetical protein
MRKTHQTSVWITIKENNQRRKIFIDGGPQKSFSCPFPSCQFATESVISIQAHVAKSVLHKPDRLTFLSGEDPQRSSINADSGK